MIFSKCRALFALILSLPLSCSFLQADVVVFADPLSSDEMVPLGEAGHVGQSGETASLDYLVACRGTDGDLVPVFLEPGGLVIQNEEATFASVSPSLDFTQAGGDGFRVRVDIRPEPGSTSYARDSWAQIHFGGAQPNRFVWAQGFGILIHSDTAREDGYQVFYNGTLIATGRIMVSETYRFDIVVENGEVAFAINGELQAPFEGGSSVYPVGSLRLGYVTMGSHQAGGNPMISGFSNLSLERLEVESGSLLILSSLSPPQNIFSFVAR